MTSITQLSKRAWYALFISSCCVLMLGCGGSQESPKAATSQAQLQGGVSEIVNVQPMTGIVFWQDSEHNESQAISLEFAYMLFSDVVTAQGQYDWSSVDNMLGAIAQRNHQAILRFRFTYPGFETAVPNFIKQLPDYVETQAIVESQLTWFPDWSHPQLQSFSLAFFEKFAERYDQDNRLAFLQVGFGLWGEYHIDGGPEILNQTFPSLAFQTEFLTLLDNQFEHLKWSISIDAARPQISPFYQVNNNLSELSFGLFDDSLMNQDHQEYNEPNWDFFDRQRYQYAPAGGEFSYFTSYDQSNVLAANGPYNESYQDVAKRFYLSYVIGNDQPNYHSMDVIKQASLDTGYKFKVSHVSTSDDQAIITATNIGTAPIYYPAYFSQGGVKSANSLAGLQPGQEQLFVIDNGQGNTLTIESERLLDGQTIDFIKAY